jgi:uncharacterized protein (DUF1499 family)
MTDTDKPSRLVTFLGRLGLLCLIAMPLTVLSVRLGLHFSLGLPVFALTSVLALLVCLCLVIVSLLPGYRAERGRALLWTLPALPPVIIFLAILLPAGDYPPIHDITTDTQDPPLFDSGVHYRGADSNPVDIKPDVIEIQREHYPDLDSIESSMSPEQAFEKAVTVAEAMGWHIYNSDPVNGIIEAEYTSFWFGFKDDIVIRVRSTPVGSEIDLRSVSRVGRSDLGANAARIRAFVDRY